MEYRTVRETAENWNLSVRMVQQLCTRGRVPGARKFGKTWAIPADAERPRGPRAPRRPGREEAPGGVLNAASLMPLMNTPFRPGQCLAAVEAMVPGPQRDIALAEYHYFTGRPEEAAREAFEACFSAPPPEPSEAAPTPSREPLETDVSETPSSAARETPGPSAALTPSPAATGTPRPSAAESASPASPTPAPTPVSTPEVRPAASPEPWSYQESRLLDAWDAGD